MIVSFAALDLDAINEGEDREEGKIDRLHISGSQTKLDLILKLSVLCHPSHRIQMYIVSKVEVHSGDLPTYRRTVHG